MKNILFKCSHLLYNTEDEIISQGAYLVENKKIKDIGTISNLEEKYINEIKKNKIVIKDFGENYILPGLINCHTHICFPGDGTLAEDYIANYPDEVVSIRAAHNAQEALKSGVTTIRDLGGINNIVFSVRKSIEKGLIIGPRLILAGAALTIPGGHMHYLKGEVDSKSEIKRKIGENIKNGADCIKIINSGGGTYGSPLIWKKSFEFDDLQLAIKEAHRFDKPVTAHVSCVEAMIDCINAGIDGIEHCDFRINENDYKFDSTLAKRIAKQGIFVGKTLPSMYRTIENFEKSKFFSKKYQLTDYNYCKNILNNSKKTFIKLYQIGVELVASTDAGWRLNPFADFVTDLELMVDCGMSSKEALTSATITASKAIKMSDKVGTLEIGKYADFIVVNKNPLENVSNLRNPKHVFLGGKEVRI